MNSNIEWNDVIKKEARGIDDEDLGEVQEVQGNYVLVQKGIINKEKFYIPKDRAESYDGDILRFRFSEQELNQYQTLKNNIISILDCIDVEDDPDEKFVFVIAPFDEDPTSDNNPVENA